MSIGLYDADFVKYGQVPFNLELMKLSAYYKKRKEIVSLTDIINPERYSNFYLRKDYIDGSFPSGIFNSNITYGGYAFNPGRYIPLDMDIELSYADPTIYNRFQNYFVKKPQDQGLYNIMYRSVHLRLSLDGKTIMPQFTKQINEGRIVSFFFHDLDLGSIENAPEVIEELVNKYNEERIVRIGTKFPIQTNNFKDLYQWSKFVTMREYFPIEFTDLIEDKNFVDFVQEEHSRNFIGQFRYNPFDEDFFSNNFNENLIHLYLQLMYATEHKMIITLEIPEEKEKEPWYRLFKLFNGYCRTKLRFLNKKYNPYCTMYSYVKAIRDTESTQLRFKSQIFTPEELRELFYLVQEKNYELFKLFYNCGRAEINGGELIPCLIQLD